MEEDTSVKLWLPYADTCTLPPYVRQTQERRYDRQGVITRSFHISFVEKATSEAMLETGSLPLSLSLSL